MTDQPYLPGLEPNAPKVQVVFSYQPPEPASDPRNTTGLTPGAYEDLLMTLDHTFGAQDIDVHLR